MPTCTLTQLDSSLLSRVDGDSSFYAQRWRYGAINEGLRVVNLFSGFYQGYVQVPDYTVADQVFYIAPTGILFPLAVWFEERCLQKTTLAHITETRSRWPKETTDNTGLPVSEWIPLGLNLFAIHPADSAGGNDLRVFGVKETPVLASGSDVLSLEDEYAELVIEYAAHLLPFMEGGKPWADAALIYPEWMKKIRERIAWTKAKAPGYFEERRAG